MLRLAVAYNKTPNSENADAIKKMYIMTAKHLFDQGWAAGSGLGTMHHQGYNTRGIFTSLFLMRKPLKEAGILDTASSMTQWFTNIRYIYNKKYWANPDADYFNTMSQSSAMTLIMMPNSPEKVAALNAFSKFYSRN